MSFAKRNTQLCGLVLSYIFLSTSSTVKTLSILKMLELTPPCVVRGMKKLDRILFDQTVNVPCLTLKVESVKPLVGMLKKYLLKLENCKPIRPVVNNTGDVTEEIREVLLNPKVISCFSDFGSADRDMLSQQGVEESCLRVCPVKLTYNNWSADDVLAAILPEGVETASSYSLVGHILHLNLREHLNDYKHVIGEVLLDKVKPARTVVNKVETIDNKFRVFNMEVLAGEHNFITEVKENYVRYKFDFSTVYWNPRLCSEHDRIVKKLNSGNILFDVFAGVGPFSIPAAKKKCIVFANDLNPESYKWLQFNAKLNKVDGYISASNKDGTEFIKEDVKQAILNDKGGRQSHVVMNLPAISVTFLSAFKQLFTSEELKQIKTLPIIHLYCFVKGEKDSKEMAQELIESELSCSITKAIDGISFVRNVAPNKDMIRVSFHLTEDMILGGKRKIGLEDGEQELKKIKEKLL